MRKYYYKDVAGQQHGPFKLDALKGKISSPETPVWYDPLPKWTTAAEVDELKSLLVIVTPVAETITTPVEEIKEEVITVAETPLAEPLIETPVVTLPIEEKAEEKIIIPETPLVPTPVVVTAPVIEAPVVTSPVAPVKSAPKTSTNVVKNKKSTAWLSWVLSILVLGGVGYYIYQDIEKGKTATTAEFDALDKDSKTDVSNSTSPTDTTTTTTFDNSTSVADTTATNVITTDPVTTTEPTTTTPVGATDADKKAAAKKKQEEEKKKAAAIILAKQKADDIKKQELAAKAALAKELQYRNSWSKYITVGALNPTPLGDDGINAFDVPVYNATDAVLDKVTIRIDYYKKEKKDKIVGTETITVYKVPGKSGMVGKAAGHKRSRKAVATIIGVNSRKIHLCYPQSGSNAADPYYCN